MHQYLLGNNNMSLINITNEEKKILIEVARKSIDIKLNSNKSIDLKSLSKKYEIFNKKYGVFVTLKINQKLRGCIGNIIGYLPLIEGVYNLAQSSAFEDPRFNKLTLEELDKIKIEITILSELIEVKKIEEIKIGRDGLYLKLGLNSGVFLPQVPVEQNWDLSEYLNQLSYKAGLTPNCYKENYELSRFEGLIIQE